MVEQKKAPPESILPSRAPVSGPTPRYAWTATTASGFALWQHGLRCIRGSP